MTAQIEKQYVMCGRYLFGVGGKSIEWKHSMYRDTSECARVNKEVGENSENREKWGKDVLCHLACSTC